MSYNPSLDFLNMIKSDVSSVSVRHSCISKTTSDSNSIKKHTNVAKADVDKNSAGVIAVIDTETNWRDEVMSIGVALADSKTFKCTDTRYYIIDPEYRVGGIYSNVLHYRDNGERRLSCLEVTLSRSKALQEMKRYLTDNGVIKIFAYNAKFDLGHLRELDDFEWYDIMRLAAYKQYNSAITESMACCKTGRLKTNYGVEPITRMLTGDNYYCEVHNAVYDAVDELRIIELLGHELSLYECAKIN
ncbi:hypothetical protein [Butyrivibrio sp.]|uniref:hypothetical protein n=1 Tax=Butyrivibrio sp. TaxID=28121 RepID=UPI0025BD50AF|nr:hypothetical protein [Butyrivibrio sp.]